MILDTIGLLNSAYQYGKYAYVGGGQTGQLHNILEPAVYGVPVLFGTKHHKFPEASLFVSKGFGFEVSTKIQAKSQIEFLETSYSNIAEELTDFMSSQSSLSNEIVKRILKEIIPR